MDRWNREELYRDIWQEPMLKLSKKYGVSNVMLGKVCRKLSIPVPGRGYWARKAAGYSVSVKPLPKLKNIPTVQRFKLPNSTPEPKVHNTAMPEPEPTDPEYLRIREIERTSIILDSNAPLHRIVAATIKAYRAARPDSNGFRRTSGYQGAVSLNITDKTFDRAIPILNAIAHALDREQSPLKIKAEPKRLAASIFEQEISFEMVEKYRIIRIPEQERKRDFFSSKVRFESNGILEVRIFHDRYRKTTIRDYKKMPLESQISAAVAAFFEQARNAKLAAERKRQEDIENRERQIARLKIADEIREEEKKVADLNTWVTNWLRARQFREFIAALEETWSAESNGEIPQKRIDRLKWMKQQADRLDPLVESPPSILDRKNEVSWY